MRDKKEFRQVNKTIIEDPKVAQLVSDWQNHKVTEEELEEIKKQDKLFEGMYIQKL